MKVYNFLSKLIFFNLLLRFMIEGYLSFSISALINAKNVLFLQLLMLAAVDYFWGEFCQFIRLRDDRYSCHTAHPINHSAVQVPK